MPYKEDRRCNPLEGSGVRLEALPGSRRLPGGLEVGECLVSRINDQAKFRSLCL